MGKATDELNQTIDKLNQPTSTATKAIDKINQTIDKLNRYEEMLKSKCEFMQSEKMMEFVHENNAFRTLTQIQQNSLDTTLMQEMEKHTTLMREMEKDLPLMQEMEKMNSNWYSYFKNNKAK